MSGPLQIGDRMTPIAHWIGPEDPVSAAQDLMHTHRIRHLPVLSDGKVVGIVTMSDLSVLQALSIADPDDMRVKNVMAVDVYKVSPAQALGAVAREMAQRRIGSALVVEADRVLGIFTASDGLRVLADVLEGTGPER